MRLFATLIILLISLTSQCSAAECDGFKRARWRRLWRVQIQEHMTASIHNIMTVLRNVKESNAAMGKVQPIPRYQRTYLRLLEPLFLIKEQ